VKAVRAVSKERKCICCDRPVYSKRAAYCNFHKQCLMHNTIKEMQLLGIWSSKYYNSKLKVLIRVLKRKRASDNIKLYFKHNY